MKLWPFCSEGGGGGGGGGGVKTCFVAYLWVNHACIFALSSASFTLVQLACSSWVSGSMFLRRGRDNAVSRFSGVDRPPWHREAAARNPAPTHSWDDCAGARHAVLGFCIGFAWYHETPFLATNAAGRAVAHSSMSAMVTLMAYTYFKWIIYISHNLVWIHNL